MSLVFKATNPGSQTALWPEVINYRLNRFADKPGTLSLEVGDTGIGERAIVDCYPSEAKGAAGLGDVVFRGYVMPFSAGSDGINKMSIPAIEKLLDGRWAMPVRYPPGVTVERMLSSDWPTDGEPAGLLCQANNAVPKGSFRYFSGNLWRLPQGGTSYLGDLSTKNVWVGLTKLVINTGANIDPGEFWQDSTYLYINSADDPNNQIVLVEGCLDTTIRLGSITGGTATFTRSWRVGSGKIQSEIARLLDSAGLEYLYDYNDDGQTYLIAGSAVGRGQSATNRPTYKPDRCSIVTIRRNTTAGNAPAHIITGMGIGKGSTRQAYSEVAFPPGLRFIDRLEWQSMFSDQLEGVVGKIYADRQEQDGYQIEAEDDPTIRPLDWVRVEPEHSAPVVSRVMEVVNSSDSLMKIYVGQRIKDAQDLIRAKLDAQEQLQKDLDLEFTAINCNGQENLDNATPCDIILEVPEADWDVELADAETWLMSIKITAFESSVSGGGGSATNHGVGNDESYTGDAGAHSDHDLGGVTGQATNGNVYDIIDQVGVDYVDVDGTTVVEDVTFYNSVNQKFAGENHVHGFGSYTYPGTADDHDNPLPINPAQPISITQFVKRASGLGSLAYVTVTATIINSLYPTGAVVPGTPYYDVAINETISDLDVRGLIVPGQNTVRISIVKYGGVGDVKARAHVSISGKVALNY